MKQQIRNFCIIAHIDHGKSTLADRFLEVTQTVAAREMKSQLLDQMDLERERGITIKLQPVRMKYHDYELNLIDTPGHVDFGYEVSRSLAAVEGAILLVDASQGIEAQTLANLYLALEQNLEIVPVINKIDLPNARPDEVTADLVKLIGCAAADVLRVSAKTGEGVPAVLDAVIARVPAPTIEPGPLRMLVFDSFYDEFRGVVAFGRVVSGSLTAGDRLRYMASKHDAECLEVGIFTPKLLPAERLHEGEIGYVVTGLKDVQYCRVGDTITATSEPAETPLPGYKVIKPMVFAGVYCKEGDDYARLRDALEKLSLSDASLTYESDHSEALGFGFRCGFLGLLHLEIFQERLTREYGLRLVVTAPSVGYRVVLNEAGFAARRKRQKQGARKELSVTSPLQLPDPAHTERVEEPWMAVDVIAPSQYIGAIMSLTTEKRGVFRTTEYLDEHKVVVRCELPLAGLLADYYDTLKSVTAGYASLNYDFLDFRACDVRKMDIFVAEEPVEALATIVYADEAYRAGRVIVDNLKELLPRQMFEVKIQAALGAKVIASARLPALRKDVTAKLYGGDVTRKRKLLEKQKKGKRRMRALGKVDIPAAAFRAVLKR